MAAIGSIRKQGKVLAGIIGGSLILFIVQSGLSDGGAIQDTSVGSLQGKDIDIREYQEAQLETKRKSAILNPRQMTDADIERLDEQAWNQITLARVLEEERKKLGISVSPEELFEVSALKPNQVLQRNFTDPQTGQFSKAAFSGFLNNLDQQKPEQRQMWLAIEEELFKGMENDKYNTLVKDGIYAPTWQAKSFIENRFKKVTADYVFVPFSEISDEEIKVGEKEIQNYLVEHAAEYQAMQDSRTIQYAGFLISPSKKDIKNVTEELEARRKEFSQAEDDSLFLAINSERKYTPVYTKELDMQGTMGADIFMAPKGAIVGPYAEGDQMVLAKVLDKRAIADSVKARHILISGRGKSQEAFNSKKDSVLELLADTKDFGALAKAVSEDPGSAAKGGDLGWIKPGQMVKPFNDKIFYEGFKKGYLYCYSDFGFHIIDVTRYSKGEMAVKAAYYAIPLIPSEETGDSVFKEASKFYTAAKTTGFDSTAEAQGVDVRTPRAFTANSSNVPGLGNARDLVRWSFTKELGDISSVKQVGNYYLVAKLSVVTNKGLKSLDEVKDEIKFKLEQEKKGAAIIAKYKDAFAASSIAEVASKAKKELSTITDMTFETPYSREIGRDLKVAGTAFGLKEDGQVSKPVIGNKGVYVIARKFFVDAPQESIEEYKAKVREDAQRRAEFTAIKALEKAAEIEDKRYKY